jgi:hypothetical protein
MPQPLSWKVCRYVQTSLARPGASPLKLSTEAFVACHEIVKGENDEGGKMFLFFLTWSGADERFWAILRAALPLLPES